MGSSFLLLCWGTLNEKLAKVLRKGFVRCGEDLKFRLSACRIAIWKPAYLRTNDNAWLGNLINWGFNCWSMLKTFSCLSFPCTFAFCINISSSSIKRRSCSLLPCVPCASLPNFWYHFMHPALLLSKNSLFCINLLAPKISYVCQSAYWYLATPHSTILPENSRGTVVMTAQVARFGDVKGCSCWLVLARLATVMQIPLLDFSPVYVFTFFAE
jgi:hypothetical protein